MPDTLEAIQSQAAPCLRRSEPNSRTFYWIRFETHRSQKSNRLGSAKLRSGSLPLSATTNRQFPRRACSPRLDGSRVERARFIAAARLEFLAEVIYYSEAQAGLGTRFSAAVEAAAVRGRTITTH